MLKLTISHWEAKCLFEQNPELYERLFSMEDSKFIEKPKLKWTYDEKGNAKNDGYDSFVFYINEVDSIDKKLLGYCKFEGVEMLEMMGGARINTENVFEAAKRNQIMLPNHLMLNMKELIVETNACTNAINDLLKEGWKLIAVLPQHQQSRPDYILGKMEI